MDELLVVKYGSNAVTNELGPDQNRITNYARGLQRLGRGLIIVTSGAVRSGEAILRKRNRASENFNDQSLATIGNAAIMQAWQAAFEACDGHITGEVLVTHREINDTKEGPILVGALNRNLEAGIVSVVNENDVLSTKELAKLAYGADNDGLASHIAQIMRANTLAILTNEPGLLDDHGEVVRRVAFDPVAHLAALSWAGERDGNDQGMPSKVEAVLNATTVGIHSIIGGADENIDSVLSGLSGTHFEPNPMAM